MLIKPFSIEGCSIAGVFNSAGTIRDPFCAFFSFIVVEDPNYICLA